MKIILTTLLLMFCLVSFSQDTYIQRKPYIEFDTIFHNFGVINFKEKCEFEFKFKNLGKRPLIIKKVKSNCGCTVPEWKKKPVRCQKTGSIKVKYDTKWLGFFTKSIYVYTNATNSPIVLKIKGSVEYKDDTVLNETKAKTDTLRLAHTKQKSSK